MTRVFAFLLAVLALCATPTWAQERSFPKTQEICRGAPTPIPAQDGNVLSRPTPGIPFDVCAPWNLKKGDYRFGCYGHGHPEYHKAGFYDKFMKNCCHQGECRPTKARQHGADSYAFMVDGVECVVKSPSIKMLNLKELAEFQAKGLHHTIHVCAARRAPGEPPEAVCGKIYCTATLEEPRL